MHVSQKAEREGMRIKLRARAALEEAAKRAMAMAPLLEARETGTRRETGGDDDQGQGETSDEDTGESEVADEEEEPEPGPGSQRGRRKRPAVKTTYALRKKRGN
jgi:hypothetical protein